MQLNYQPSNELSLLLNAATLGCRHNRIDGGDIPWQHIDWHKTLKLANFHGLSCWLAEYLKDETQVPTEIKKRLAQKQRAQLLSHMYTEQQKCALVSTLNEASIRFAILKGVAIAKPLYKERWYYRSIADLDILIDPVQLKQAFSLIKMLGYSDVSKNPLSTVDLEQIAVEHKKITGIEHSLVLPKKLSLDIHWKLRRNTLLPIQYEDLFNNIIQDNRGISRLTESLEFIHICIHGTNDGWRKLKALNDILSYAQNITDWSIINERAQKLGVLHIVNISLAVCDFFFGTCYGPTQLTKQEQTLFTFIINGFARDNEFPCVHSYLDKSNIYRFIKTTLSWWLAISSNLVSKRMTIKDLLAPSTDNFEKGVSATGSLLYYYLFKRVSTIIRKYYLIKK